MVESEIGLGESDWPVPAEEVLGDRGGFGAWCEYAAARALTEGLGWLPIALQNAIAGGVARIANRIATKRRLAASEFVRQALGPEVDDARVRELVLGAWRHLFVLSVRNTGYTRRFGLASPLAAYRVSMPDEVRAVLDEQRGAILVTPHVGDWEAGGAAMPWVGFKPFYVVSRPPRNRPLSRHFQRMREQHHVRLIHRHGAAAAIPAILAGRGSVLMMLDQRTNKKPLVAPFFGREARCERGAAVMMRRLGVPVVFYACYLTDEPFRYDLCFSRVLRPEDFAGKDPIEIVSLINREMEALILAHPEQYFWLHDRYRKN